MILSTSVTSRRDISASFSRSLMNIISGAFVVSFLAINFLILKKGMSLLGGLFQSTSLNINFHVFTFFITFLIVQLTGFFPRKYTTEKTFKVLENLIDNLQFSNKIKEQYSILEYPLIILFVIHGAIFFISSSDIISIFLCIELQSYGLYLLCALYRNSELSTGASLIYFLLGGLSSCFILLSSGIIYTYSGTSILDNYYIVTNLSDTSQIFLVFYNNEYINYSLTILSVGLLFKIGAAPFHFWSPQVYDAIPTIVTTFVANIAKLSILVFLVELVHYTGNMVINNLNWTYSLLISSLLSLIIGSIVGLNQLRIKKLLAYSTISHLGFMLLALSINSIESIQAFLFYLMQYLITNVNCFFIIISIGYSMYVYKKNEKYEKNEKNEKSEKSEKNEKNNNNKVVDQENSPIQLISQLKGYYYLNPVLALSLTIVVLSFTGRPPLVGFFGKQMVLSSALDKGFAFMSLIAVLTSVVSAVYYLNIIKEMFFEKSDCQSHQSTKNDNISLPKRHGDKVANDLSYATKSLVVEEVANDLSYASILSINMSITISILTLIIILFLFFSNEWLRITNILAILIFF